MDEQDPLLSHQQRVVDKLLNSDQPGLVAMHGLGSGKTRTSLEAYKALGLPTTVIAPASLKENYIKEIKKWLKKQPKDLKILSQQNVARNGISKEDLIKHLLIIDEAHRLRNNQSKGSSALKHNDATKRLLLSGTPIYNNPADIAALVNIAAGKEILPENKAKFEDAYISKEKKYPSLINRFRGATPSVVTELKNKEQLKEILNKYIDYYQGDNKDYPTIKEEEYKVPMGDYQNELYQTLLKKVPAWVRFKIQSNLPPGKNELDKMMAYLVGARQVSDSTNEYTQDASKIESPKIEAAFNNLSNKLKENENYKALVYSNFLRSGVQPYENYLTQNHIPFGKFTGDTKDVERNKMVHDYNLNKLKVLLVSSAGGEGLDLKGTRLVQLLEPHFNQAKERQVIGRAARYQSHSGLPTADQNVLVQRYFSTPKPTIYNTLARTTPTGVDEYLKTLATNKEKLNNQLIDLIKN